jgi:hypothetical protein
MEAEMSLLREILQYLHTGRYQFRAEADENLRRAEKAYQGSMTSAYEVTREAAKVRSTSEFIREVLNGQGHGHH